MMMIMMMMIIFLARTQYTYQNARHKGLARTRGISRNNAEFAAESTRVQTILEARPNSLVSPSGGAVEAVFDLFDIN